MEMASNYIKNVVGGVFGMEITHEVIIEGHAAAPDQAEAIIAEVIGKSGSCSKRIITDFGLIISKKNLT